jgi:protein-disulfide isomerase
MKKCVALAALIILTLLYVQPAFSESTEELKGLRKDIEALKEGQKSIQKDLREIKSLLQAKPAAQPAAPKDFVLSDTEHLSGDKNAKVVIVEYSDYQ